MELLLVLAIVGALIFLSFKYNFLGLGQQATKVEQGVGALKNAKDITNNAQQAGSAEQGIIDNISK